MILDDHYLGGVRIRRQYQGLDAEDMARRLGIKRTSYLRLERGERQVLFSHAIALAEMLNCTCEQLTRMPTPDELREIYIKGQQQGIIPTDDTTGELLAPLPDESEATEPSNTAELDNLINKTEGAKPEHPGDPVIVVDVHAQPNNDANNDLANALAGWDDSE